MNVNYALLLIALPLALAFLQPLFGMLSKKLTKWITFLTLGFNFIYSVLLLNFILNNGPQIAVIGNWKPPFGINLYISALSLSFACIVYFVGLVISFYSIGIKDKSYDDKLSLVMLLVAGSAGAIIMTGDLFNMFVFIEILSIGTAILVASRDKGISYKGALKYMIFGAIGSSMLLFAIGFIYATLGTLNFAEIALRFHEINPTLASFIVLMFAGGVFVEAELFPFNLWVPDSYEGSAPHIDAILSGIVSTAGIYAIMRVFLTVFGIDVADKIIVFGKLNFNNILIAIGVITTIIGEFSALTQKDIKKVLAFSSMAQMGIIAFAIGVGSQNSITGGVFHLFNHAISKGLLFLTSAMIIRKIGSSNIDDMEGFGRYNKFIAIFFAIGAFGIIGIPFFNGFWSKMYIVQAAVKSAGISYLAISLILGAALIEVFYYFRIIFKLFVDKKVAVKNRIHPFAYISVITFAIIVIAVGVYPSMLTYILKHASAGLFEKGRYISTVLGTGVFQ
ncbi:hypothetical protein J7K93_07000 [bacterium]|nr:hypothetical protein [bacterium]